MGGKGKKVKATNPKTTSTIHQGPNDDQRPVKVTRHNCNSCSWTGKHAVDLSYHLNVTHGIFDTPSASIPDGYTRYPCCFCGGVNLIPDSTTSVSVATTVVQLQAPSLSVNLAVSALTADDEFTSKDDAARLKKFKDACDASLISHAEMSATASLEGLSVAGRGLVASALLPANTDNQLSNEVLQAKIAEAKNRVTAVRRAKHIELIAAKEAFEEKLRNNSLAFEAKIKRLESTNAILVQMNSQLVQNNEESASVRKSLEMKAALESKTEEVDRLTTNYEHLGVVHDALRLSRDDAKARYAALVLQGTLDKQHLQDQVDTLAAKYVKLETAHHRMEQEREQSNASIVKLKSNVKMMLLARDDWKGRYDVELENSTRLRTEIEELEEGAELREPLVMVGARIRARFLEQACAAKGMEDTIIMIDEDEEESSIQAGNHAAHRANCMADVALFELFGKQEDIKSVIKKVYGREPSLLTTTPYKELHNVTSSLEACTIYQTAHTDVDLYSGIFWQNYSLYFNRSKLLSADEFENDDAMKEALGNMWDAVEAVERLERTTRRRRRG